MAGNSGIFLYNWRPAGRKDTARTIRIYLDAFTGGDDVALIIETGNS